MIKKLLYISVILAISFAQNDCIEDRYLDEIFDVQVTSGIEFGANVNDNLLGIESTEALYMDIYQPQNDEEEFRPLILILFGGAFVGGSRTNGDVVEMCTRYAKMGYVAAAIDYRLTTSLIFNGTEENAYRAAMKAIHDMKAAIRFFRMNDATVNEYNIDSDRIYTGGFSAGAIAAINGAYLDQETEIPDFIADELNDTGGLEGLSGTPGYDSDYYGIVNLCGAIGDLNWITDNDTPIVSIHNTDDEVVSYSDDLLTLFGINVQVYGSYRIHEAMIELGNNSALLTIEGEGHCLFSMDTVLDYTSTFMYDLVCADPGMLGDVNDDGFINILDVVLTVNFILESTFDQMADMNDDGAVNVLDIVLMVGTILEG